MLYNMLLCCLATASLVCLPSRLLDWRSAQMRICLSPISAVNLGTTLGSWEERIQAKNARVTILRDESHVYLLVPASFCQQTINFCISKLVFPLLIPMCVTEVLLRVYQCLPESLIWYDDFLCPLSTVSYVLSKKFSKPVTWISKLRYSIYRFGRTYLERITKSVFLPLNNKLLIC